MTGSPANARSSPLRVLHVIPAVARRYGGPSAAIVAMCLSLRSDGVDARIVATDADGPAHLPVPTGTPTSWEGVPALFFRNNFSESFKYSRALAAWLREHVSDFDVVHIHAVLSHASITAGSACRRAGVPYIVRPLGTIASWSLGRKALKKRVLMGLGARRLLQGAAMMHYTSESERADAEQTFGLTHGTVIPLGVEFDQTRASADRSGEGVEPYVLALSRVHPKKNFESLIEAFAGAGEAVAGWRLVVAGDGDSEYLANLKALALRLGVGRQVDFPGWVDGEYKRALIDGAALFALPSHHENFGLVVLEAAAAGVPLVLARGVQLATDVEQAEAGWVTGSDVPSLLAALLEAIASPQERERRGRAARAMAARFSWPAVAARLMTLYRELSSERRHQGGFASLNSDAGLAASAARTRPL